KDARGEPPASLPNLCTRDRIDAWLSSDGVPHRIENVDEIARRTHVAEQRHPRKHFHLAAGNVVNAPQLLVLPEIFPGRLGRGLDLGAQEGLRSRIGQEKTFASIEPGTFPQ